MKVNNQKKGIIYGIIGIFLTGFEPIVANSRPMILDAYFFAATSTIVEALVFLPLMTIERKKLKSSKNIVPENNRIIDSQLNGWKKNKLLLIYIGLTFGIGQILFFLGYQLSGAINGSLAQKATVIFSLLFSYLILKESISKIQIIFSFVLIFGLIIAVTQGSLNLLEFNIGVLIIFVLTCIWMLAHVLTKPMFKRNEITPMQLGFIRNIVSGIALFSTYFLFFPIENVSLFNNPINIFYIFAMGIVYSLALWMWYETMSLLDVSKASIIISPTPIVTALYATILLGEAFTIFHLIGTAIVILSIIIIVRK